MESIEYLMDWLNYHHLLYFWTVAKEGSISKACERLQLAQPTISAQLQTLERSLGEKLFHRVGRGLVLTETGHLVYRYADEIFGLGRELVETLKGRPTGRPMRLSVGVADPVPKMMAYRLLKPALEIEARSQMVCHEGAVETLLAELALHRLDMVLSDTPVGPGVKVKVFQHELGECAVSIFGTTELVQRYAPGFPRSLDGAPFLLATPAAALRRSLEQWFDSHQIRPEIRGEFDDSALMKSFGQAGAGLFAAPSLVELEIQKQYGVTTLGLLTEIKERFFAITLDRKLKHPAVVAISEAARRQLVG